MIQLSLNLLDSNSDITKKILSSLKLEIDRVFTRSIPKIQNEIRNLIRDSLMSEPEYSSLVAGKLKYEFGIPTKQKVDTIIETWIKNILIKYTPSTISSNSIKATLSLSAIKDDYSEVLNSEAATIIDSNSGAILPWLEWLLLYGGKIIVQNFSVKMGPSPRSRTGMAIMVKSNGQNWRVPPEFAGTKSNNWVTRALTKIENKVIEVIQKEIENQI